MDNRTYNIYFHTHTVSGIIICAVLFVMFFAGSFSFFKDDITAWQKNTSYVTARQTTTRDFSAVLDSLGRHHPLKGRDFEFFLNKNGVAAYVSMLPSHDSLVKKQFKPKPKKAGEEHGRRRGRGRGRGGDEDAASFAYDFGRKQAADYEKAYDMGEFLYRLHFLAPLNFVRLPVNLGAPFGYLLAGLTSFIFLFALITGLLLHWQKIVSNFFTFRPFSQWKTVWTDLHTALGVIQFPFQFVFAVTGVVLIVNSVLLVPFTQLAYQGNREQVESELYGTDTTTYAYTYTPLAAPFDLNEFVNRTERQLTGARLTRLTIRNYQDANMHVIVQSAPLAEASFAGSGLLVYRVRDQAVLSDTRPTAHSTYVDKVSALVHHLHFGDFGGRPLRLMYFVLGVLGCVVIISGIFIWLVARDKASTPARERRFNFWTANIFLGVCLSMLPVTAFTMIALLFLKEPRQSGIFHWYFYSWLALAVYFIARRNIALINQQSLVLSTMLCFLLPLLDGAVRGNWFWTTYAKGQLDILFIDALFLALALVCGFTLRKLQQRQEATVPVEAVARQVAA